MTVTGKNFSGMLTPTVIADEYVECNFSQPEPLDSGGVWIGHRLFPGDDTPRMFTRCNLTNAEPPPASTVNGGLTTVKQFAQVVGQEVIEIDGFEITRDLYADIIYGRWTITGYEYLQTPEEIPVEVGEI